MSLRQPSRRQRRNTAFAGRIKFKFFSRMKYLPQHSFYSRAIKFATTPPITKPQPAITTTTTRSHHQPSFLLPSLSLPHALSFNINCPTTTITTHPHTSYFNDISHDPLDIIIIIIITIIISVILTWSSTLHCILLSFTHHTHIQHSIFLSKPNLCNKQTPQNSPLIITKPSPLSPTNPRIAFPPQHIVNPFNLFLPFLFSPNRPAIPTPDHSPKSNVHNALPGCNNSINTHLHTPSNWYQFRYI